MLLLCCCALELYPSLISLSAGSLQYHRSNSYCLQQEQAFTLLLRKRAWLVGLIWLSGLIFQDPGHEQIFFIFTSATEKAFAFSFKGWYQMEDALLKKQQGRACPWGPDLSRDVVQPMLLKEMLTT